jgi:Domain of unknown function (DUF4189)
MKNAFASLIGLMLASGYAHAEGNCPEGYYPYNATGVQVACAPIPGYGGNSQPADPGPSWETRWGAIAAGGGGFGAQDGMSSKRRAHRAAMHACKESGGGKSCKVLFSYYNQCGAIAWGDNAKAGWAGAPELDQSKNNALKECSSRTTNCKLFHSGCSYPQQVR